MNILTVENITKDFGERKLFHNTSFYMHEGEKVGVIGINGTGKTTLLKMIAGMEEPDSGSIITANHIISRYLPQHPVFNEDETVLQAVLRKEESEKHTSDDAAWTEEIDAKAMLTKLGVVDFDAKCGTLSGGQRKRLALVSALLSPADILILDEPTNHLDNEMADWLEDMLKKRNGAIIMVTHDRYFLDHVSGRIIEIDHGQIYSYQANYSGYLEQKAIREEASMAGERKRQSLLRTELEWVRRGARARSTKQKARLERYEDLKNTASPMTDSKVEMGSVASRLGKSTVEINHISKKYGDKILLDDFSYIFLKNDRIGFIGPNGCGKTTLMKILIGECKPDTGSIDIGQTVKIGYYAQEIEETEMPADKRVIDYIKDIGEYVKTENGSITASQMLERFLFIGSEQYTLIGKLSGGEKRRLHLLKVLMDAPNVLILDEPTNDLDIATLTVLEDYLDDFPGIVITVSHDRYFLDRIVQRIFAFEEKGKLRQYEGGYTDYHRKFSEDGGESQIDKNSSDKVVVADKKSWKTTPSKLKFTFNEQKEFETIESDIADLEDSVEELERKIIQSSTDFVRLNELTKEKEETEHKLEEKMERWMYLEELKVRIDQQDG